MRLTLESVYWVKLTVLSNVCGPQPISWVCLPFYLVFWPPQLWENKILLGQPTWTNARFHTGRNNKGGWPEKNTKYLEECRIFGSMNNKRLSQLMIWPLFSFKFLMSYSSIVRELFKLFGPSIHSYLRPYFPNWPEYMCSTPEWRKEMEQLPIRLFLTVPYVTHTYCVSCHCHMTNHHGLNGLT